MCGTGSVEVVAIGVTSSKVVFLVDEGGKIGESHSAIRRAAHIRSDARYCNANVKNGNVNYEDGIPAWLAKQEAQTSKQLIVIEKKMAVSGPAYAKRVAVARRNLDKALVVAAKAKTAKARQSAEKKALAVFETAKKTAFSTIAKMGGIAI